MKRIIFPLIMVSLAAVLITSGCVSDITGRVIGADGEQPQDNEGIEAPEFPGSHILPKGAEPQTTTPSGGSPVSGSSSGGGGGGSGGSGSGASPGDQTPPPEEPPEEIPEEPEEGYVMYFSPNAVETQAGSLFFLEARVNSTDVFAVSFQAHYDKDALVLKGHYEGDFLKQGGVSTYPIITVNQSEGIIYYDSTRYGTTEGASGDGELLILTFEASQDASLSFSDITLVDSGLNPITGVTSGECPINVE